MSLRVEWPGLEGLVERLRALRGVDLTPVATRCAEILVEGNRRGVLAGLDGNNAPMPPLKYRGGAAKKTRNRRVPDFGTTLYETTGAGPFATGLHDNLTTAQYKQLTGPRLAPRREGSRVIKNLHPEVERPDDDTWVAVAAWDNVRSPDGTMFLPYHFNGADGMPRYDLRPIRPEDFAFCANALKTFAQQNFLGSI